MNTGLYVFSQVILHLPARAFDRCVEHFEGNKYVKHFTCWNQLLCMMFGQLSGRDSLRDLLVSITPHKAKFYHLGFGKGVSRSNLQFANEQRDYRIFEEFAYVMIDKARACSLPDSDFALDIAGPVYAFDSTFIDLCLSVFWWAEFRAAKGAVKIHTLIDVKTSIPCFVHITDGATHDLNGLDLLKYENGGYYVLDRGYSDFERLFTIHQHGAYFVTRPRSNLTFVRITSRKVKKKKGILCDQTIKLVGFYSLKRYPIPFRRIRYYDKETEKRFIFITNNFDLAIQISMESRTLLQVDKTTPKSKIILGNIHQCSEDPNLHRYYYLHADGSHQKQAQIYSIELRNTANLEHRFARQSTAK